MYLYATAENISSDAVEWKEYYFFFMNTLEELKEINFF